MDLYSNHNTITILSYILLSIVVCNSSIVVGEKYTHLHFYFQDDYTGSKPSVIKVVSGPRIGPGPRYFGDMVVLDNKLTRGPNPNSTSIGRAQGFAVRVSHDGVVSELLMHLVFESGKFNGSTLAVFGRIDLSLAVRRSSIVSGSGHFNYATGYALSRNYDYSLATGGSVEFDVYVVKKCSYN